MQQGGGIAIMAAVPKELSLLDASLEGRFTVDAPFRLTGGRMAGKELLLCTAGVGKANAAGGASWLLERYSPSLLIITGCGGAYLQSGLVTGDLAVATEELFVDEGVMVTDGWLDLRQINLALAPDIYNSLPLCTEHNGGMAALAERSGLNIIFGRFATVSSCSGTALRGMELENRYQVICENMEGAAAALMAHRYKTPCIEIRGISNLVEDRDFSRWEIDLAVKNVQMFLAGFLEEIREP